jgi:hypothetical protein
MLTVSFSNYCVNLTSPVPTSWIVATIRVPKSERMTKKYTIRENCIQTRYYTEPIWYLRHPQSYDYELSHPLRQSSRFQLLSIYNG